MPGEAVPIRNDVEGNDLSSGPTPSRQESPRPHFERPPLNEVVCGVQFEPIPGWLTSHYGLFWSGIRSEYSRCEDHPPLPRVKLDRPGEVEIELGPLPPLRRVFLVHKTENYVLQLQPNRFLHNWRKTKDSDPYPRFDDAFARFSEHWRAFCGFVRDTGLPAPQPEAYELTYLNYILSEDSSFPRDVWRFLDFYKSVPTSANSAQPIGMSLSFVWPLPERAGQLQMVTRHGKRADDQKEVLVVEFTATGKAGQAEGDMERWFGLAHDSIVQTFAALTTEEAHRLWGRIS